MGAEHPTEPGSPATPRHPHQETFRAISTGKASAKPGRPRVGWGSLIPAVYTNVCAEVRWENEYQHLGEVLRSKEEERGRSRAAAADPEGRAGWEPGCPQAAALFLCCFSPSKEDKSNGLQQIPGITK